MPPELEALLYCRLDTSTKVQLWNAFTGQPVSN